MIDDKKKIQLLLYIYFHGIWERNEKASKWWAKHNHAFWQTNSIRFWFNQDKIRNLYHILSLKVVSGRFSSWQLKIYLFFPDIVYISDIFWVMKGRKPIQPFVQPNLHYF